MKKLNVPFHIVLIEPEIPPNTGNIARLCAATGTHLHLVGKLGFSIDDKHLKRAGLDYWPHVQLHRWDTLDQLIASTLDDSTVNGRFWFSSKKAHQSYTEVTYQEGDYLVLGKETFGLPEVLLDKENQQSIRIPIIEDHVRSLNLATSAGIMLYEALRQTGALKQ